MKPEHETMRKHQVETEFGWAWWCMPGIPALGRPRQENLEFEVCPDYKER
jgi:hypothetical protein